jgi:hypothetical protein
LAGVALAGTAYFLPWRKPPGPAQPGAGYVNSSLCAGCHRQIAQTYRLTGMGRSLYRPSPENTAPGSFYHRASDRYYTMLERGGKFYQRRHQIGFGGKETNVLEEEADYVVGSGNHARAYLHRSAEGKLVELPVSWYAERGGYWAMSPGYDRVDQQEFRRAIPDECVFCHAAYPLSEPAPDYSLRIDSTGRIDYTGAIDCQRCHGPGRSHIEVAGSGRATPIPFAAPS